MKLNSIMIKIRVILRIVDDESLTDKSDSKNLPNFVVDDFKRNLIVYDPTAKKHAANISKAYAFDAIYKSERADNLSILITTEDILQSILRGINVCLCCVGQTSEAKSRTLFGDQTNEKNKEFGILPLSLYWLFQLREQSKLKISLSVMEISEQEENVRDLLDAQTELNNDDNDDDEDQDVTQIFEKLSKRECSSLEQTLESIDLALKARDRKLDISFFFLKYM